MSEVFVEVTSGIGLRSDIFSEIYVWVLGGRVFVSFKIRCTVGLELLFEASCEIVCLSVRTG